MTSQPASTAPDVLAANAERLMAELRARTARVGVIGLGYVGLPLAVSSRTPVSR